MMACGFHKSGRISINYLEVNEFKNLQPLILY